MKPALDPDKVFRRMIAEGATLLLGNGERISREAIEHAQQLPFSHFLFLAPASDLQDHCKEHMDPKRYSILSSTDGAQIDTPHLLVSGIDLLDSTVSQWLGSLQCAVTIFYSKPPGLFITSWATSSRVTVIEHSLLECIKRMAGPRHAKKAVDTTPPPGEEQLSLFTDREEEYQTFLELKEKEGGRCIKLVGMAGIGKRSFLQILRHRGAIARAIEFDFLDPVDDPCYVIEQLSCRFHRYEPGSSAELNPQATEESFFSLLHSHPDLWIVLSGIERIVNFRAQEFYNPALGEFLDRLVQSLSHRSAGVLFLSECDFSLPDEDGNDPIPTIHLRELSSVHTLALLDTYAAHNELQKPGELLNEEDQLHLIQLVGGHPHIAQLLMEASRDTPLEDMIRDPEAAGCFGFLKAKYLFDKIRLHPEERRLLAALAMFTTEFDLAAVAAVATDYQQPLTALCKRFLLSELREGGRIRYTMSSLVRFYATARMAHSQVIQLQQRIGDYYCSKLEHFESTPAEQLRYYRLCLYHYSRAENRERITTLRTSFRPLLLSIAKQSFEKGDFSEAYQAYQILDEEKPLPPFQGLFEYLLSASQAEPDSATELYEKAMDDHPDNSYLLVSFAHFLFRRGDIERAEELVDRIKEAHPHNKSAARSGAALRSQILSRSGRQTEAVLFLQEAIEITRNARIDEEYKRKELVTYYSALFNSFDWSSTWDTVLSCAKAELGEEGVNSLLARKLEPGADQLLLLGQSVVGHPHVLRSGLLLFAELVQRQGEPDLANELASRAGTTPSSRGVKSQYDTFYFDDPLFYEKNVAQQTSDEEQSATSNSIGTNGTLQKAVSDCQAVAEQCLTAISHILRIDPSHYRARYHRFEITLCLANLHLIEAATVSSASDRTLLTDSMETSPTYLSSETPSERNTFVCYNTRDQQEVLTICDLLKARQIQPWVDVWRIRPGDQWRMEIDKALQASASVLILLGAAGVGSWQRNEVFAASALREADEDSRPIIPVLLPSYTEKVEIPLFLRSLQFVDLRKGLESGIDRIVWGITGIPVHEQEQNQMLSCLSR